MRRRGSIYIAVLGVSVMVTVIGIGALNHVRVERRIAVAATQLQQARLNARAGVDLMLDTMRSSSDSWRNKFLALDAETVDPGLDITLPAGRVNITLTDPVDGVLDNNPYDPALIRATGIVGDARQIYQTRVVPTGLPMAFLQHALSVEGGLQIDSGDTLQVVGASALTNNVIRVNGQISGNALGRSFTGSGVITGSFTTLSSSITLPDVTPLNLYSTIGTAVTGVGATISNRVIAPGVNPWSGGTNAAGVYVITTNSDLMISDIRLEGTLIIRAPGRRVTIDDVVFMRPARADYPVLIVDGDLELSYDSDVFGQSMRLLSELASLYNFNPPAAPYNGSSDIDVLDAYPSRIEGLIHVRGKLTVSSPGLLRGALIVESASLSEAATFDSSFRIEHNSALVTNPPMGYTRRVDMAIEPSSWTQIVDP